MEEPCSEKKQKIGYVGDCDCSGASVIAAMKRGSGSALTFALGFFDSLVPMEVVLEKREALGRMEEAARRQKREEQLEQRHRDLVQEVLHGDEQHSGAFISPSGKTARYVTDNQASVFSVFFQLGVVLSVNVHVLMYADTHTHTITTYVHACIPSPHTKMHTQIPSQPTYVNACIHTHITMFVCLHVCVCVCVCVCLVVCFMRGGGDTVVFVRNRVW